MTDRAVTNLDVLVVGAGFAGLYMLYSARRLGLETLCIERGASVGGTWYWNRYPGARCDVESLDYSYSFSDELQQQWQWTEKFATQPEILAYANHVADRFDLRRSIRFECSVVAADYDESTARWLVQVEPSAHYAAKYFIMATGCLSAANRPHIEGIDTFGGRVFHTAEWPSGGVNFSGRRVGVIGTGSSGVQAIPLIAEEASHLDVFQRTPTFSMPARNKKLDPDTVAERKRNYNAYRQAARYSRNGIPMEQPTREALSASREEREAAYEEAWSSGRFATLENTFTDLMTNKKANDTLAEFVRNKIRAKVNDPVVAEKLLPDMPFAAKRVCMDTNYYETFNKRNVRLVDVSQSPIERITEMGITTRGASYALDDIVFATGFDAMTGALLRIRITGRDGLKLQGAWREGPHTYLGVATVDFPNMFFITGPGSPSVLSNMMVSIEQHVEWITGLLAHMEKHGLQTVEPEEQAQEAWVDHVNELADQTLYPQANSWYLGANIPGKKRVFMPYVGGVDRYRKYCEEVAADEYKGFVFDRAPSTSSDRNAAVDQRIQTDQPQST